MSLKDIRDEIRQIDENFIALLLKRIELVKQVAAYKKENGLPVEDPEVELENWHQKRREVLKKGGDPDQVLPVYEAVLDSSRKIQRDLIVGDDKFARVGPKIRIGVMGAKGSFSEAAALKYLKNDERNFEIVYPITAEEVLKAVVEEKNERGVLPLFNTIAGLVFDSVYALGKYAVLIEDHFDFEVSQCLLIRKGGEKSKIRKIMSHPHALGQCRKYLKKIFPDAELIRASDTALAAEVLANNPAYVDTAVIAPKNCAEIYGLELFAQGINDMQKNLTHFLVVKKA